MCHECYDYDTRPGRIVTRHEVDEVANYMDNLATSRLIGRRIRHSCGRNENGIPVERRRQDHRPMIIPPNRHSDLVLQSQRAIYNNDLSELPENWPLKKRRPVKTGRHCPISTIKLKPPANGGTPAAKPSRRPTTRRCWVQALEPHPGAHC